MSARRRGADEMNPPPLTPRVRDGNVEVTRAVRSCLAADDFLGAGMQVSRRDFLRVTAARAPAPQSRTRRTGVTLAPAGGGARSCASPSAKRASSVRSARWGAHAGARGRRPHRQHRRRSASPTTRQRSAKGAAIYQLHVIPIASESPAPQPGASGWEVVELEWRWIASPS